MPAAVRQDDRAATGVECGYRWTVIGERRGDIRTKGDAMCIWRALTGIAVGIGLSWLTVAHAQGTGSQRAALTAQDRAEILRLLVNYTRALSSCAAKEYAGLFTPDGVFSSDDFRGGKHRELYGKSARLVGREKLTELVETEEFCLNPETRAARARTGGNASPPPADAVIEPTAEGARGTVPFATGGRYEDVYVKTSDGWRFKSRSVFMPPPISGR
jgi:hypothetical protein